MTDTAAVLTERQGHILIVTINRPEARNAVNADVHVGIGTALEEAETDPEIRVVIVTVLFAPIASSGSEKSAHLGGGL